MPDQDAASAPLHVDTYIVHLGTKLATFSRRYDADWPDYGHVDGYVAALYATKPHTDDDCFFKDSRVVGLPTGKPPSIQFTDGKAAR